MRPLAFVALLLAVGCEDPPKSTATSTASATSTATVTASATTTTTSSAPASPSATTSATAPPTEITAQHVLVAYKGAKRAPAKVTRSKAEAKTRADEVAAKAKAGEDFTALVKSYSEDPEAESRLGSVGKFGRDKLDKAFTDAAFALKVGETSGPVETPFGFHVIKRNQ